MATPVAWAGALGLQRSRAGTREGLVSPISVKHRMNYSVMKYISVSSPHTCNMSKNHVLQNVLMQPDFHPVNWRRPSVSKAGFAAGLHNSQESDSESLVQERQYQSQLQQRIRANEELLGLYSEELENDSLEEDVLEEMSLLNSEGAEYDTSQYTNGIQKSDSNERKQESVDKYSSLKYNPNWKNTKEAAKFFVAEKACHVAGGSSVDSFYLHYSGSSEEKDQQEAKSQDSFSEFDMKLLSFHEPNAVVSNKPFRLHTEGKEPASGCHSEESPGTHGSSSSPQTHQHRPQRAKKDFVGKNKQTLGLRSEKINSYLQLHSKKQEVLQGQGDQTKPSQRNKTKSNQSLKGRALPGNDSQPLPGRPAEPKSWHHRHHHVSDLRAAPTLAVEQDSSSARQKGLCPGPSVGPSTGTAANSDTCLNNFPNPRHFVIQDFTTSTYPFPPALHKSHPAEVISAACTCKENNNYQRDSPNGLPRDQQLLYNYVTEQLSARGDSTSGQAHPNQRNISSAFNVNFQELLKDQISFQDCKKRIYVDESSPTALGTTSQPTERMEQHLQEITCLTEGHIADRGLFNILPPINPEAESGSEVDPERCEGNQVKTRRSNSEKSFSQVEKQKQPKAIKKPHSSKPYINLDVKLGGLGPDYEAIKEKKEKLKQQKEYAKQIKERNIKSISSVQRLPTKPQVVPSVSRQKALEYAKKIPKPKTFTARLSDEEVKEEKVLPQTLNGTSLPQIEPFETLQSRHEKEKQVVAAFRTLHIL